MTTSEVTELRRALGELRECIGSLRSHYGDSAQVQRLANDVDRLSIDVADVTGEPVRVAPAARAVPSEERVVVSDTPYDPGLWAGADDEGVGGYHRHG